MGFKLSIQNPSSHFPFDLAETVMTVDTVCVGIFFPLCSALTSLELGVYIYVSWDSSTSRAFTDVESELPAFDDLIRLILTKIYTQRYKKKNLF